MSALAAASRSLYPVLPAKPSVTPPPVISAAKPPPIPERRAIVSAYVAERKYMKTQAATKSPQKCAPASAREFEMRERQTGPSFTSKTWCRSEEVADAATAAVYVRKSRT